MSTKVVKETEEQVEKNDVNSRGKTVWKPKSFKEEIIIEVKW